MLCYDVEVSRVRITAGHETRHKVLLIRQEGVILSVILTKWCYSSWNEKCQVSPGGPGKYPFKFIVQPPMLCCLLAWCKQDMGWRPLVYRLIPSNNRPCSPWLTIWEWWASSGRTFQARSAPIMGVWSIIKHINVRIFTHGVLCEIRCTEGEWCGYYTPSGPAVRPAIRHLIKQWCQTQTQDK